jgi:hypothetical protein
MSLQRVIETARRTGTPVIVTDIAGREPMVILPLEQFEALAGEPTLAPTPRPEPVRTPSSFKKEEKLVQELEDMIAERTASASPSVEAVSLELPVTEDVTLEERFYLEPVEDKPSQG